MIDIKTYSKNYNDFARKVLGYYCDTEKGQNIITSPYSILTLLAIAADATAGETSEQILRVLPSGDAVDSGTAKNPRDVFGRDGTFKSANAVCVRKDLESTINESYREKLKEHFGGELFVSNDIVSDVNDWAKAKTKGMIDQIAESSMRNMVMALLNAACFEGKWTEDYTEDDIEYERFCNADKSASEVAMLCTFESEYIENESFTGFVKPYENNEYSFMALLPKTASDDAIKTAIHMLDFSEVFSSRIQENVEARIPEFRYTSGGDVAPMMRDLGITTIFSDHADFSPLSSEWLRLESVIHKARIEVDRQGTKAAAVTMGAIEFGCAFPLDKPKVVELDRPFVYAIMDNKTGLPVFTGIVNKL